MRVGGWLILIAVMVFVPRTRPTHAQQDDTTRIVDRTARYVSEFVSRFSNIVAEEVYIQERTEGVPLGRDSRTRVRRTLTSDFLFVRTSDSADWLLFRDVRLVNGREVGRRENRLLELFTSTAEETRTLVRTLSAEFAQHGLSDWPTMNNPLIALSLLQDTYRHRFTFSLDRSNKERETVVLRFREHVHPTLLRTFDGPAALLGQFWADAATGRISQTELRIGRNVIVKTVFADDERLHMAVPVEMREQYTRMHSTGLARYSNFRTFQVQTQEQVEQKAFP